MVFYISFDWLQITVTVTKIWCSEILFHHRVCYSPITRFSQNIDNDCNLLKRHYIRPDTRRAPWALVSVIALTVSMNCLTTFWESNGWILQIAKWNSLGSGSGKIFVGVWWLVEWSKAGRESLVPLLVLMHCWLRIFERLYRDSGNDGGTVCTWLAEFNFMHNKLWTNKMNLINKRIN